MATESVATRARELSVEVSPSPFDGSSQEVTATVSAEGRQLTFSDGARTVAVRPVRAVMGHGTLHLTTAEPPRRLRLVFARYDVAAVGRQQYASLSALYQRLSETGFRELLVALRAHGVPVSVAPRLRRGAGAHRATAWVSAYAFLFVELAWFGLPASLIGALAAGVYATSTATTVGLIAALACFLVIAAVASPIPPLVRQQFGYGSTRDPIGYVDAWTGRQAAGARGVRPTFVPGVPVPHTVFLLIACAAYPWFLRGFVAGAEAPDGQHAPREPGYAPAPSWLDGDFVSLLGYAATGLLLTVFVVSLVRWRREPELHGIRWAALAGTLLCFAFGQTGADLQYDSGLQAWLPVGAIIMIVAFTTTRVAIGFAFFTAMIVLALLAGFDAFSDASALLLLGPPCLLLVAIAARYFPGGARLVPLPAAQAVLVRRLTWALWGAAAALVTAIVVALSALGQPG